MAPIGTDIHTAAALLKAGKLVAFPTETVYGLGADATDEAAVQRIFQVKGRPSSNPLIVHVPSLEQLLRHTDLSKSWNPEVVRERLMALQRFWPGPLSVVLPKNPVISCAVSAGGDTVALRIPRHPIALKLLSICNIPVAAPSANPSMYISPTTAQHVHENLGEKVEYILDGGSCDVGLESTVLSLLGETPVILRPGAITAEQISEALTCEVQTPEQSPLKQRGPLLSPGLLAKHYSPKTKVALFTEVAQRTQIPNKSGAILFSERKLPWKVQIETILSKTGDLAEVAANLFAALREFDRQNLDLIIVDTCEPIGLGAAIMDRLIRASADS
jgi:L-threonylcarbamoyladenylate synthase